MGEVETSVVASSSLVGDESVWFSLREVESVWASPPLKPWPASPSAPLNSGKGLSKPSRGASTTVEGVGGVELDDSLRVEGTGGDAGAEVSIDLLPNVKLGSTGEALRFSASLFREEMIYSGVGKNSSDRHEIHAWISKRKNAKFLDCCHRDRERLQR